MRCHRPAVRFSSAGASVVLAGCLPLCHVHLPHGCRSQSPQPRSRAASLLRASRRDDGFIRSHPSEREPSPQRGASPRLTARQREFSLPSGRLGSPISLRTSATALSPRPSSPLAGGRLGSAASLFAARPPSPPLPVPPPAYERVASGAPTLFHCSNECVLRSKGRLCVCTGCSLAASGCLPPRRENCCTCRAPRAASLLLTLPTVPCPRAVLPGRSYSPTPAAAPGRSSSASWAASAAAQLDRYLDTSALLRRSHTRPASPGERRAALRAGTGLPGDALHAPRRPPATAALAAANASRLGGSEEFESQVSRWRFKRRV